MVTVPKITVTPNNKSISPPSFAYDFCLASCVMRLSRGLLANCSGSQAGGDSFSMLVSTISAASKANARGSLAGNEMLQLEVTGILPPTTYWSKLITWKEGEKHAILPCI